MATNTFGRRGAVAPTPRPSFQPAAPVVTPATALDHAPAAPESIVLDNKLLADIPFLTAGMIVFLLLIFALERHLAIDVGKDGSLNGRSLIAFGALSRDLVVGSGEWWRIGLAPLLHASMSHIVGNCIALFFVGIRLEPMIGRGWFVLIFVASALGGVVGSLTGNVAGLLSVGASGAITGLIGALFVVSFDPYADPDHRRTMRRTSLFFGVPALLPLALGASGNVDYFAHAGGALVGGALGLVLWFVQSYDSIRPHYARGAGRAALAGLIGSLICVGFAASHYATYMADAAQYIRASELPDTARPSAQRSAELLARYPKDPRAHLIRAIYFVNQARFSDAEAELRATMSLAASDVAGGPVRSQAQAILATVLLEQGRRAEAKTLAADLCRTTEQDQMRRALSKAKLCD